MDVPLNIFFLFFFIWLLRAAKGEFDIDYEPDSDENTRQFIQDENKLMRKLFKEEMGNLYRNLSESFNKKLLQSVSNITIKIKSHDEAVRTDHRNLSSSILNLTTLLTPPTVTTEVEEVNAERGTIEFTGGSNSNLRTKIWILRSEGGDVLRLMSFVLKKNRLGDAARLSLWCSLHSDGYQQMWNGSQSDWRTQKTSRGHVILMTLLISPEASEIPSFKLEFNTTHTFTYRPWSSKIVLGKGPQVVSFSTNNAANYTPWSEFVALVASPSGEPNELSLKYLDIPGTPPDACGGKEFSVWLLEESPTGLPYTKLPSSICRPCGRVGPTSEFLGAATFAILRFTNDDSTSVKGGFIVQIN